MTSLPRPLDTKAVPRPRDMEQLVRCLERQFGQVSLSPDDGYTKLVVRGVAMTFLEAERVCLGEAKLEDFEGR